MKTKPNQDPNVINLLIHDICISSIDLRTGEETAIEYKSVNSGKGLHKDEKKKYSFNDDSCSIDYHLSNGVSVYKHLKTMEFPKPGVGKDGKPLFYITTKLVTEQLALAGRQDIAYVIGYAFGTHVQGNVYSGLMQPTYVVTDDTSIGESNCSVSLKKKPHKDEPKWVLKLIDGVIKECECDNYHSKIQVKANRQYLRTVDLDKMRNLAKINLKSKGLFNYLKGGNNITNEIVQSVIDCLSLYIKNVTPEMFGSPAPAPGFIHSVRWLKCALSNFKNPDSLIGDNVLKDSTIRIIDSVYDNTYVILSEYIDVCMDKIQHSKSKDTDAYQKMIEDFIDRYNIASSLIDQVLCMGEIQHSKSKDTDDTDAYQRKLDDFIDRCSGFMRWRN